MKKIILLLILFILIELSFASEYVVPKKPNSVDVADIDLDGDLDIVIGHKTSWGYNNPTISILENEGNGIYSVIDTSFVFCGNQFNIFAQDLNADCYPDIISWIGDYSSGTWERFLRVYYNDLGLFNSLTDFSLNSPATFTKGQVGDIDSDNDLDVAIYSNSSFIWGYLLNDGVGQFSSPVYYDLDYPPVDLAIGDLNGDERDDILVAGGGNLDAWFNFATGLEFTNLIDSTFTSQILISDVDHDGDNDIVASIYLVPGAPARFVVFTNDDGIFSQSYLQWIDESMARIYLADLNNDDYPDVIYNCSLYGPNSNNEIFNTYILFNNQDGTFSEPVSYYTGICSHKSHAADLDENGWNDIITLNYDVYNPPPDTCRIHILFNDGTGNFVEESQTVGIGNNVLNAGDYKLMNYPNPFNPSTTISFSIPENGFVKISVYDIKGRLVRVLRNKKMEKGEYDVIWDGRDRNCRYCSSGIYLMSLTLNEKIKKITKAILMK